MVRAIAPIILITETTYDKIMCEYNFGFALFLIISKNQLKLINFNSHFLTFQPLRLHFGCYEIAVLREFVSEMGGNRCRT